jgi:hypothetical protein
MVSLMKRSIIWRAPPLRQGKMKGWPLNMHNMQSHSVD